MCLCADMCVRLQVLQVVRTGYQSPGAGVTSRCKSPTMVRWELNSGPLPFQKAPLGTTPSLQSLIQQFELVVFLSQSPECWDNRQAIYSWLQTANAQFLGDMWEESLGKVPSPMVHRGNRKTKQPSKWTNHILWENKKLHEKIIK